MVPGDVDLGVASHFEAYDWPMRVRKVETRCRERNVETDSTFPASNCYTNNIFRPKLSIASTQVVLESASKSTLRNRQHSSMIFRHLSMLPSCNTCTFSMLRNIFFISSLCHPVAMHPVMQMGHINVLKICKSMIASKATSDSVTEVHIFRSSTSEPSPEATTLRYI